MFLFRWIKVATTYPTQKNLHLTLMTNTTRHRNKTVSCATTQTVTPPIPVFSDVHNSFLIFCKTRFGSLNEYGVYIITD